MFKRVVAELENDTIPHSIPFGTTFWRKNVTPCKDEIQLGTTVQWVYSDPNHDDVINGTIFRVTGPLCWKFTGTSVFPTQRPVTRSLDVFFDLRLNKRLS